PASSAPLDVSLVRPPLVVVPVRGWDKVAQKGLHYALNISPEVHVVHIDIGEDTEHLRRKWPALVESPTKRAGLATPQLVVLTSAYRDVIPPILEYGLDLERRHP